jgi:putative ABC transport system ATP-binding protein
MQLCAASSRRVTLAINSGGFTSGLLFLAPSAQGECFSTCAQDFFNFEHYFFSTTRRENGLAILTVSDVEKIYQGGRGGVAALKGVSFQSQAGDFIALMGPSGCGKSSLLHILGGIDRPTKGSVRLDDVQLDKLGEEEMTRLRRKEIGFIFQFFNLLPTLTVLENIALPLLLDGAGEGQANQLAENLLIRVGLEKRASHYPAELSGGEMQRTAVARALIINPKLVLADEPTGNLDSENGEQVMKLLAEINCDLGVTIILATHSDEAAQFTHRIIRMRDGLIERVTENRMKDRAEKV